MLTATNCHPSWTDPGTAPASWFTPWAKAAAAGGYQAIRFDVSWTKYAPAALADILTLLRSLKLVPIITLAGSGPNWPAPDPWAYAAVAQQVASQLQNGEYLEIWNEPNQIPQFAPVSDPVAYARLVWLSSAFVRQTSPQVKVIAGAVAFNDQAYIKTFLGASPKPVFDVLSVHPYTIEKPPDQVADKFHSFMGACQYLHGLGIPWCITEVGWSSTISQVYDADTDARAASYYRASRQIAQQYGALIFTSFELGDAWNHGESSTEMALLNSDMSPRLTFAAAAGI